MRALVMKTDGTVEVQVARTVTYEDTGTEPELDWLKRTIECRWVEMVQFFAATDLGHQPIGEMWIDEHGKLEGKELNVPATTLFQQYFGPGDVIVGNAVFFPRAGVRVEVGGVALAG